MSVLIKGMEMPYTCFCCPFFHKSTSATSHDGFDVEEIFMCKLTGEKSNNDDTAKRLPNCPMVEISENKRTIEKEIFCKELNTIVRSGDKFSVDLNNGEEITFVATHDKNGNLFFVTEDCLNDCHVMNEMATNKGGWSECEMRKYLNKTVFALLPDELQAIIKPTKIVQVLDGKRTECEDKLFLLSKTQVFGEGDYSENEPEDSHFDIFKRVNDRIKECDNHGTFYWWLRSPYSQPSTRFCGVNSYGGNSNANAANRAGVAFGFSI